MNQLDQFSSAVKKPLNHSKLQECSVAPEHRVGSVERSAVHAGDTPVTCRVQRKLYDMDDEQELLLRRFQAITETDCSARFEKKNDTIHQPSNRKQKEFVLITGRSGTGKSTLALTLKDAVERKGGYFLRGKFDQLQHETSYKPLVHAFTEWLHQISTLLTPPHGSSSANPQGSEGDELTLDSTSLRTSKSLSSSSEDCCSPSNLVAIDIEVLRSNIIAATGGDVSVLCQMMPVLSDLLDFHSDESYILIGGDARHRLFRLFVSLVQAICQSIEAPMVLFLDDLQWADQESLDLVVALLAADTDDKFRWSEDWQKNNLMIFGACRDNDVSLDHSLSCTLRSMEDTYYIVVTQIHLNNLRLEAVCSLVSNTLHVSSERAASLAAKIFGYTNGNGFSTIQILRVLLDSSKLQNQKLEEKTGEVVEGNRTGAYVSMYDFILLSLESLGVAELVAGENMSSMTNRNPTREIDPVDLLKQRIKRFPLEMQQALQTMACLGAEVQNSIIIMALDNPGQGNECLREAEKVGLIESVPAHFPQGSSCCSRLCFSHDMVQEASYKLIPVGSRPLYHLSIGRRLLQALAGKEKPNCGLSRHCCSLSRLPLHDLYQIIVNQLLLGKELLDEEQERVSVARLCFCVGAQLAKASSFRVAASYLENAIDFLPDSCWNREDDIYDMTLEVHNVAAEVHYSVGNYARSDALVSVILANARSPEDTISAHTTRMYSLGSRHQLLEAIETGLFILDQLGESMPRCIGPIRLLLSLKRTKRLLRRYRTGKILFLPSMEDEKKLAAMRILNLMFTYAFSARPEVAILTTSRLVQLTLKHGLSAMSAPGFAMYAMVLRLLLNDHEEALQYGSLATQILEKFKANEWIPRVHAAVYGMANTNCVPLRECIEKSIHAYRIGLTSGDIEFSMMSLMLSAHIRFYVAQEPLHVLRSDFGKEWTMMVSSKQENVAIFQAVVAQAVHNLVEQTNDPITLTGKYLEEQDAISVAKLQQNDSFLVVIFVYKGYLAYLYNNYERGAEYLRYARSLNCDGTATVIRYNIELMEGLTSLAIARASCVGRRKRLRAARRCLETLTRYAKHSPTDLKHRMSFFEAEFSLSLGNLEHALAQYDFAYETSCTGGFLSDSALILERKAMALKENGREDDGNLVLRKASALYCKWGAVVKANAIGATLTS